MGMVSGILPVVGVPLPFISYGGTAMVTLGPGPGHPDVDGQEPAPDAELMAAPAAAQAAPIGVIGIGNMGLAWRSGCSIAGGGRGARHRRPHAEASALAARRRDGACRLRGGGRGQRRC